MDEIINNDSDLEGEEKEINNDLDKDFDIDKTLFSIKQLQFNVDKVKQKLNLDIKILKNYGGDYVIFKLKNKKYRILPQARMMKFVEGKNVTEKFIYSKQKLRKTLNDLKFKLFIVYQNEKYFDSIDSEIAKEEINDIFDDPSINQIIKINSDLENIIDKFHKKIF